jgi:5-methylcytosine-specific restriction endonuclease McrA
MTDLVYSFDAVKYRLGTLCKRGHQFFDTGKSLRRNSTFSPACVQCEKERYIKNQQSTEKINQRKEWRAKNKDKIKAYRKEYRNELQKKGLTQRGTKRVKGGPVSALQKAILNAGKLPTVGRLVMKEQFRYWKENPGTKAVHDRQWRQASWWLKYQTRPDLRLYTREKSKRRKAVLKGATAVRVSTQQINKRFLLFKNCCAYCGQNDDMQIEHAVPIAQGGTHAIGNILPACKTCNYSKRDKEIETWYRSQPFFTELKWNKIRRTLGWAGGAVNQLAMI